MKRSLVAFVLSVLFLLSAPCFAEVFSLGPDLTNLETVSVGDPGNAGELSGGGYGPDRICGAVSYSYYIGKYEVTTAQYTDFLNHVAATDPYGLYNTNMWSSSLGCKIQQSGSPGSYIYSVASDWANRPVNYVSYWDSCRFANWLHNDQPAGPQGASTTEDGAYYLNGYTGSDGRTIQRKAGWKWAVTSEDEWYKAAYYKGSTSNAYWDYPMQSDVPTVPSNDLPDSGNNGNFWQSDYSIGSPCYRTNVGEFGNSESHFDTFDQGGNVWEWNEAVTIYQYAPYVFRGVRGGAFDGKADYLLASTRYDSATSLESSSVGFRVSSPIPEPSSLLMLGSGLLALAGIIRRKR